MRTSLIGMALAGGLASLAPAAAQSPLDGPLASPDAFAAAPAPATHFKKPKSKKARHAAAKPATATPTTAGDGAAPPPGHGPTAAAAPASGGAPDDPLSLGMKWNGNNDTSAQTRSQNLDGNAFGSGAEVGMKLHF